MTNEEAVKIFQHKIDTMDHGALCCDYGNDKDAFVLAMQLLKKEPCEDCISRQEVLEIAKSSKSNWIDNSVLFKRINELPPVTPRQKVGRWIKYGVPRCGEQHYQCTSCGYYINFGQWGELYTKEFKYCPNCMARMQEVEDNG